MAASIDPLRNTFSMRTGVAHLRSLPAPILLDLALKRAGPSVLITPILHEIIHHACANSAVNVALQHRWLELLRLMLSTPALGCAVHEDHLEMAADLAAAEAIFQPLAEGIAHFSEFDCAVPESRMGRDYMLGPTDALLWRLLSLKEGVGSHVDQLFGQLQSEQLDPRTVKRKTDVLCNRINPLTGNDTYLVGYLTIKSLWNKFVSEVRDTRLRAPSFLNFVMYYIYEDWELARIILTPGPVGLGATVSRLSTRLKSLFDSDIATKVAAFTADMAARSRERQTLIRGPEERAHGAFHGLDLTQDEMATGMRATARFYVERVGPGAALSPPHKIEGLTNLQYLAMMTMVDPSQPHVAELMQRRHVLPGRPVRQLDFVLDIPQQKRPYCFLLDIAVDVRTGKQDQLLLSVPSEPGSVRGLSVDAATSARFTAVPQACRLVGVITSTAIPWALHCFLLRENALVLMWSHGTESPEAHQELQGLVGTIVMEGQMELYTQLSFTTLSNYILGNQRVQEEVSKRADAATQAIVKELRQLLEGAGWSGLFGKKVKHDFGIGNVVPKKSLNCLAAAGLCNAFRVESSEMDQLMRAAGYSLSDALEISANAARDASVTLIRTEGNRIHVQV
jgi:hypothetical protein